MLHTPLSPSSRPSARSLLSLRDWSRLATLNVCFKITAWGHRVWGSVLQVSYLFVSICGSLLFSEVSKSKHLRTLQKK